MQSTSPKLIISAANFKAKIFPIPLVALINNTVLFSKDSIEK